MRRIVLLSLVAVFFFTACANEAIQGLPDRTLINPETTLPSESTVLPNNSEAATNKAQLDEEDQDLIVLYHGFTLDIEDRNMDNEDANYTSYLEEKYNREYDFYENGKWTSRGGSKVEGRGLDYYWYVPAGEIAFIGNYDPYPRAYTIYDSKKISNLLVNDIRSRFEMDVKIEKTILIDLDGNGETEYISHAKSDAGYSQFVCLFSHEGEIISYLLACTDDKWMLESELGGEWIYDLESDMEFLDINNDGCMEIIVTMFVYEGFMFNVYRYAQGQFTGGEFINVCSVKS